MLILDYISVLPLLFILSLIYKFLLYEKIEYFILILWMIFSIIIIELFKIIPKPKKLDWLFMRPPNSKNTNLLSNNGLVIGQGFPSGHMTITTLYCVYIILFNIQNKSNKLNRIIVIHLLLIILMILSRYYKGVHNIYQIFGGGILGTFIAFIAFRAKLNI